MITTEFGIHWRERVLVLPGWKNGFCPVHAFTGERCHSQCVQTRLEFAEAARDLEYHWRWLERQAEIGAQ